MREIVLDTETTGLDPFTGDRIVEIGAVELMNHMPTGRTFHQYINPERDMPDGAFAVHGLSQAFLSNKPVFADIVEAFLDFVGSDKMVIHNASFDMKFINAELGWIKRGKLQMDQAIDTLEIARKKYPGAQNSLDALCRRFSVDNSAREKHGALLDSEILAEVYLELIGGRQPDFMQAGSHHAASQRAGNIDGVWKPARRPVELPSRLSPEEDKRHSAFIERLGDDSIWAKLKKA